MLKQIVTLFRGKAYETQEAARTEKLLMEMGRG